MRLHCQAPSSDHVGGRANWLSGVQGLMGGIERESERRLQKRGNYPKEGLSFEYWRERGVLARARQVRGSSREVESPFGW